MAPDSETDPFADIDPVIHAPARLRLVTQLSVVESADATFLVNATGLTWGNLASHLRRLEDHGYVNIDKGYRGRKPHTEVSLSDRGRAAFQRYREVITQALDLPESPSS